MTQVSIAEMREAMAWWKTLSPEQKLHYRMKIERNDAISITRYWVKEIK